MLTLVTHSLALRTNTPTVVLSWPNYSLPRLLPACLLFAVEITTAALSAKGMFLMFQTRTNKLFDLFLVK